MNEIVIDVQHLQKTFAFGFFRKKVRAVADVTFSVEKNEIFGFLGPNGAGKTTTLKMMMGLIFPSSGQASIFGRPIDDRAVKQRLGFLPENPYFYDYLSGPELLDLMGRLFGLPSAERKKRARWLLERVGLARAGDRALRKYSKGMLQRLGLAQALINDPELVVLDEPMSGLDPIGRKEIRDLIVELKREGKTVLFSTHILSDVELICDRVAMIVGGKMRDVGPLSKLLSPRLLHTELVVEPKEGSGGVAELLKLPPEADVDAALREALAAGKHVVSVTPRRESLEDLFVREVDSADVGPGAERMKAKSPTGATEGPA
jgi:ABC-2 type transport system ATP-binding protein